MAWASDYRLSEPLRDARPESQEAEQLRSELLRELSAGDVLHAADLRVVA